MRYRVQKIFFLILFLLLIRSNKFVYGQEVDTSIMWQYQRTSSQSVEEDKIQETLDTLNLMLTKLEAHKQTYPTLNNLLLIKKINLLIDKRKLKEALVIAKSIENSIKFTSLESYLKTQVFVLISTVKKELGEYDIALKYANLALNAWDDSAKDKTPQGRTFYLLASLYRRLGKYEKALEFYDKKIKWSEINEGRESFDYANALNNKSTLLLFSGQTDSAIVHSKRALPIMQKISGETDESLFAVYNNLGNSYLYKGEFDLALNYFSKAHQCIKINLPANHARFGGSYYSLGIANYYLKNCAKSVFYFEQSLAIWQNHYGENHPMVANCYQHLGLNYLALEDYEKAIPYQKKGLTIFENKKGVDLMHLASKYEGLGDSYFSLGDIDLSLIYYKKATTLIEQIVGKNNPITAYSHSHQAMAMVQAGNCNAAIPLIDAALRVLKFEPRLHQSFKKYDKANYLLFVLNNKGKALQCKYEKTQNIAFLQQADSVFQTAIEVGEHWQNDLNSTTSIKLFRAVLQETFEAAIQTKLRLYKQTKHIFELEAAFLIGEKSKHFLLKEELQGQKAKRLGGVPDSLLELENSLETALIDNRNTILTYESKNEEDSVQYHQMLMLEKQQQLEDLKKDFANRYPAYYELKHQNNTLTIEQVKNNILEEQTALISYFAAEDFLAIFLITKNEPIQVLEVPKKNWLTLQSTFPAWRSQLVEQEQVINTTIAAYMANRNTQELSQHLLNNVLGQIPNSIKKIIFIPDGIINFIPLEALPLNNSTTEFLIHRYQVSYAYAASLLLENKDRKLTKRDLKPLAAFSPVYDKTQIPETDLKTEKGLAELVRSGNYFLAGAQTESTAITDLLDGDLFITQEKTHKSFFLKNAGKYQILHLAMHGFLNNKLPAASHLLFSEDKTNEFTNNQLTALELTNLDLAAELVVLSACNTGYGKIEKGEGVMSLARAFNYTGVPSTIMSLWKVPDKATATIMVEFYKNLKKGQRKDDALRNAKLYWLNNIKQPLQAHPYYWAGFVLNGDSSAMNLPYSIKRNWWLTGLICLIVGLSFFLFQRRANLIQ